MKKKSIKNSPKKLTISCPLTAKMPNIIIVMIKIAQHLGFINFIMIAGWAGCCYFIKCVAAKLWTDVDKSALRCGVVLFGVWIH